MIGRANRLALGILVCATGLAHAGEDPKPQPMDIKSIKAKLVVLQDAKGGTYVVYHEPDQDKQLWYGTGKTLYAQIIVGGGSNGAEWTINTWAPRLKETRPGGFTHRANDTWQKQCDGKDDAELTLVTGDKAKAILDKDQFMTTALVRHPYLLARDDSGTYYYVDKLYVKDEPHGTGHRVFVGKKGAMKQVPLTDQASDSGGDVFSTKSGDLRLVRNTETEKKTMVWVKGEKRNELTWLDLDVNSHLIYTDLGIYTFLGTLCDTL